MKQRIYFVDAFAQKPFEGNPAGVCIHEQPMDEKLMQNIAAENNLSETAFISRKNERFSIRWFTPNVEVDLCGHATLASAFILFNQSGYDKDVIAFESRSGLLKVSRKDKLLILNFPVMKLAGTEIKEFHQQMFNANPVEVYTTDDDYVFVFASEEEIRNLKPNMTRLAGLDCRGVIVTARGNEVDFVSRFFGPAVGIPEDPVTGSAHTKLIPYWSKVLKKQKLVARQLSKRGGILYCENKGDRVEIGGEAVLYLSGEIEI